ncbi:MAG: rod shape-determining protein MreC [Nitrospinota bacterium]
MKYLLRKYENIILVLALFLIASVLLSNNLRASQLRTLLERASLAVITPFQKGVTVTMRNIAGVWDHYIFLANSSQENHELKKELKEERFLNGLLMEELEKYRRVENLLSVDPVTINNVRVATVVAWDSTNLAQTLVIDKGTKHKIANGMPVITHDGLVGRTVVTASNSSRVLMMTDARSAVDAFLQSSRVRCMIVGQNRKRALIRYLPIDADVKKGDVLISSGLGGVYPKGLRLGTVSWLKKGSDRLFYEAEMAPSADFNRIEEVLVVLGKSEPEPETKSGVKQ